jgi:glucose-6-phosphate 1-dehydrogenase
LAKKKTYPSLLDLFLEDMLPPRTVIWGFARSKLTHEDLRARIRPYLLKQKKGHPEELIDDFLRCCFYQSGSNYGDHVAYRELNQHLLQHEQQKPRHIYNTHNRLFYLAIPPNVFAETGLAIKENAMTPPATGWTRVIVEKPFGRDLSSCEKLLQSLNQNFAEDQLYRIDHYLGKEMVQNLLVMRFANRMYERLWSRDDIEAVFLTFKEPFGTEGRGGYFDQYGIIRDILQNHLLQVMTLLAMEPPTRAYGPGSSDHIRDEKVRVLRAIPPITLDDVYLGQYEGYTDDPTIENKDSITPTFAAMKLSVQNPRWAGVPFILKAGKALDERKAEMRIQFKDAPASEFLFATDPEKSENPIPRNELVIRMQPHEAIYIKTNFKSPGFASAPMQGELEVNYESRFFQNDHEDSTGKSKNVNPAAYTRLILDVIRGRQAAFVRADELLRSWEIFTPVLDKMEQENIRPHTYTTGSRGPKGADQWIFEKSGYIRNKAYKFHDQSAPTSS